MAMSASATTSSWCGLSGAGRQLHRGRAESSGRRARRRGRAPRRDFDRRLPVAISQRLSFDGERTPPAPGRPDRLHRDPSIWSHMADYERSARVLVVEDDDAIAQVLQRSLRLEGYDVKLAADGVIALEEAHAFLPDLVILDLGLPRMDGIEVAKRLRESDDVPVLVLTARDAVEARVEGLDAGADDYLVKPFERQELLARLRALLRRRPPRRQATLSVGDLRLDPDT